MVGFSSGCVCRGLLYRSKANTCINKVVNVVTKGVIHRLIENYKQCTVVIENQLKVIKPNHISGSGQTLLMIYQQGTAETLMR